MKKSNLVLTLSWVIAILTLLILVVSMNKFGVLTGQSVSTDTAQANLSITSQAQLEFTVNSVDWGEGFVNESTVFALLDTEGNVVNGTNWNAVTQGLVLENKGNVNLTLNLSSSKNATEFIGTGLSTTPTFMWKFSDNESGACAVTYSGGLGSYTDIATDGNVLVCSDFLWANDNDTILLDLKVTIPTDAIGTKGVILTATGTSL